MTDEIKKEIYIPPTELYYVKEYRYIDDSDYSHLFKILPKDRKYFDADKMLFHNKKIECCSKTPYLKTTHREPKDELEGGDDFYYLGECYAPLNVPTKFGGSGVPQWLWNNGALFWVLTFGAIPAIIVGGVLMVKTVK